MVPETILTYLLICKKETLRENYHFIRLMTTHNYTQNKAERKDHEDTLPSEAAVQQMFWETAILKKNQKILSNAPVPESLINLQACSIFKTERKTSQRNLLKVNSREQKLS